ncbi:hypothetical protein F5877DRAFT_71542 [Lentinula edodes]|nr:hypothetical protein F5877DRAFT_71542 [Lentinula edodes]
MHLDVVSRRAARDPLFTLSARVPALSENPHSCAFEAAGWVLPAVAFMNALQSSGKRSRQRGRGRGGPPDGNELLPKAAHEQRALARTAARPAFQGLHPPSEGDPNLENIAVVKWRIYDREKSRCKFAALEGRAEPALQSTCGKPRKLADMESSESPSLRDKPLPTLLMQKSQPASTEMLQARQLAPEWHSWDELPVGSGTQAQLKIRVYLNLVFTIQFILRDLVAG